MARIAKPAFSILCLALALGVAGAVAADDTAKPPQSTTPAALDDDPVALAGTLDLTTRSEATLQTAEGETVRVHLGPSWYYREQGWELESGDAVEIDGYVTEQDGVRHVHPTEIRHGEQVMAMVDADGDPAWAGGRSGKSCCKKSKGSCSGACGKGKQTRTRHRAGQD